MTNQDKKDYLKKYIPAIAQLESIQTRRINMTNIGSQRLSKMPIHHGEVMDKLGENICDLVCMEDEFIEEKIKLYQEIISNVLTAIYGLSNEIEHQIMTLKYLHGMKWSELSEKMGYEERQIHRYHGRALHHIQINIKKEPSL